MAVASYTPPNDGTEIRARHIRQLWQAISAQLNGNLDTNNFASGAIDYSKLSFPDNSLPATKMEDSGDMELYVRETNPNYVVSGCVWTATAGLAGAMSSGVVRVNGIRKVVAAVASNTFTASRDTYIDIDSTGAVGYSAVTNGASSPALASNSVRIAKVVTNGTNVTSVVRYGMDSNSVPIYPLNSLATGKYRPNYVSIQGNNGASRQTIAATTAVVTGQTFTYTSGDTAELLYIWGQTLSSNSGTGTHLFIAAGGTQISRSSYYDTTTGFWTLFANCLYPMPPNTTITIDLRMRNTAGTITIANASGDIPSGFGPNLEMIAFGR